MLSGVFKGKWSSLERALCLHKTKPSLVYKVISRGQEGHAEVSLPAVVESVRFAVGQVWLRRPTLSFTSVVAWQVI